MSTSVLEQPMMDSASAAIIDGAQRKAAVTTAYVQRVLRDSIAKAKAAGTLTWEYLRRLLASVPKVFLTAGAAALMAFEGGYHAVVDTAEWAVRGLGRIVRWGARLVHRAINKVGLWTGSLVGLVSASGQERVDDFFTVFSAKRSEAGRWISDKADKAVGGATMVLKGSITTRTVNWVARILLAGMAITLLAPSFGVSLAAVPVLGTIASVGMTGSIVATLYTLGAAVLIGSGLTVLRMATAERKALATDQVPAATADAIIGELDASVAKATAKK